MSYQKFMWSLILITLPLSVRGGTDCRIQAVNNRKFNIFFKAFHWKTPIDSYNATKETIRHGDCVRLVCENGFVRDDFVGESYVFECTNGKFNETLSYEDLLCKSDFHKNTRAVRIPSAQFRSELFKCDGKNLEVYQVLTKKVDGSLRPLYTVCFDKNVMRTKFVLQLKQKNTPPKSKNSRRDVWGFDYFGKSALDKLKLSEGYVSRIQRNRITNAFPNKYNGKKKYPYTFDRGHLAPLADFTDSDDKKASCEYINVAPQWKELNGNSWSLVERETRDLIQSNPSEWEIYTGTYGSIPTTKGPLFVSHFFDQKGRFLKGFVPVPKLYWKLAYNSINKNDSVVFIGINNPELKSPEEFTDKYLICKPRMNKQKTFFKGSEFNGFTYECDLEDFLEKLAKEEQIVRV